ncbi:NO-inducible flavohemoprotein [Pantoea sp. 1.19]|uniref:NO-inducible flavohemoprotein n=1 Tax=Pantoea sp. 1.19 TaxID=1925589 RepID=UPI0009488D0E|nr:NO-inducible flavohemoprotein [Pantoea sp. 1.19]
MLDAHTIATVKSTLPAIAALGPELTVHFYQRMFRHSPELKQLFNMSNQRNGDQPKALFEAVAAWGSHLDDMAAVAPLVERIAQKHCSVALEPSQYAIVGEHLLASIDEMLHPGAEALAAWQRAYAALAQICIDREAAIYQAQERKTGGWRGTRPFRIRELTRQSDQILSVTLTPDDGGPLMDYRPGQYVSLWLRDASLAERQVVRQYSLTQLPNGRDYRIAVKHEAGGSLSGWLHQQAQPGSEIALTAPAGEFTLEATPETPVTLISGGVGLTPLLAMLHDLSARRHPAPVSWWHATDNGASQAFADEIAALGSTLPNFAQQVWFSQPRPQDAGRYTHRGWMALADAHWQETDPRTHYYLCGPVGFMQYVAKQLIAGGVAETRLHYEVFGPHKVV